MEVETLEAPQTEEQSAGEVTPTDVPPQQDVHRPLLKVDRTEGATARRHLLLPVDDSDDSEAAVRWAVDNLYKEGDAFHLLHVVPVPHMVHVWAGVYLPPDEDAELEEVEDTKDFVKHRFASYLVEKKVPFMLHVIVGSTDSEAVAKTVAKKAKDINAEAIVVAKHTKGRLKEMWLGSVTKTLLKATSLPIAVVPNQQAAAP